MFSPLAQGLLTNRYLDGVPEDSRMRMGNYLRESMLSEENLARVRALNEVAKRRGQSLAQMAIAWVLRDPRVTSALLGASSVAQLEQNVAALDKLDFDPAELEEIDRYAADAGRSTSGRRRATSRRECPDGDWRFPPTPQGCRAQRGPKKGQGVVDVVVTIWPLLFT